MLERRRGNPLYGDGERSEKEQYREEGRIRIALLQENLG